MKEDWKDVVWVKEAQNRRVDAIVIAVRDSMTSGEIVIFGSRF